MTKRVVRQSIGSPQNIGKIRSIGRTNHVLTVARKDTHHTTVQRSGKNTNQRKRKRHDMMSEDLAHLASL